MTLTNRQTKREKKVCVRGKKTSDKSKQRYLRKLKKLLLQVIDITIKNLKQMTDTNK